MKILSRLLIIFGILWCLIGGYYLFLRHQPQNLQFDHYNKPVVSEEKVASESAKQEQKEEKNLPTRIVIDDLQINSLIYPTIIKNDDWETTHNGVSYLSSSPIPGTKGNSVIYGHNWSNLFGNLTRAIPGQTVDIYYTDGTKKRFIIEYTSLVTPSESSILDGSDDTRITLYTCTGFLDSQRFVVVALLVSDSPSFANVSVK